MKKLACTAIIFCLILSAVSAYNPPVYGDSIYELSSPRQLTTGASVTGGGIFYAGPESIILNPALPAKEQRIDLNLAFTGLKSSNESNSKTFGSAFQGGILIPFKWAVFSGYANGTMVPFNEMNLGDSLNFKFGLAKEITDKLTVGLGANSGIFWGAGTDWGLSANLGFVYEYGNLAFLKDCRYAVSVLNLGKNYTENTLLCIKTDAASGSLPDIATIRAGIAGTLYENNTIKLGTSLDLTTPLFQNLIADMGLQFSVKDMLYINVAEKINFAELSKGVKTFMPAVGISFRFTFDVNNNAYLDKNGWNQNEMSVSAAWKQINETINAVSVGVDVNLGLKDEAPPVIELWIDDEESDNNSDNQNTVTGDAK